MDPIPDVGMVLLQEERQRGITEPRPIQDSAALFVGG